MSVIPLNVVALYESQINVGGEFAFLKIAHYRIHPNAVTFVSCNDYCYFCEKHHTRTRAPLMMLGQIQTSPQPEYCKKSKKFQKRLDSKLRFLKSRGQDCWAIYEDKCFVWSEQKNKNPTASQSKEFREWVLSEDLGYAKSFFDLEFVGKIPYPPPRPIVSLKQTFEMSSMTKIDMYSRSEVVEKLIEQNKKMANEEFRNDLNNVVELRKRHDIFVKDKLQIPKPNDVEYFRQIVGHWDADGNILIEENIEFANGNNEFLNTQDKIDLDAYYISCSSAFIEDDIDGYIEFDWVLILNILKKCDLQTIGRLSRLNKKWREVSQKDILWKVLLKDQYPNSYKELKLGGYRELMKSIVVGENKPPGPNYLDIERCGGIGFKDL